MSFTLPRARVDAEGHITADEGVLDDPLRSLLSSIGPTSTGGIASMAFLPLDDAHWLVGRRETDGVTWRVVDAAAAREMGHPAWLWTLPDAFSAPSSEAVEAPLPLPLRQLLRLAAPFSGSYRRTAEVLAATVQALRQRQGPVEVVVPRAAFTAPDGRAIWFTLALLGVLPPYWRDTLWVSTWEESPRSEAWDLILTDHPHEGFLTVHGLMPAEPVDRVATYLLERLLADDPEAAESAAYLSDSEAADPWLAGVLRHLSETRPRPAEAASPTEPAPDEAHDPQSLAWRLRSEESLTDELLDELALLTARTADPQPWRALEGRPPELIARAVGLWLAQPRRVVPDEVLIRVIASLHPSGPELVAFYAALVRWIDRGTHGASLLGLLLGLLEENLDHLDTPTLASLWGEWMRLTLREGLHAEELTVGTIPKELALRGSPLAPVLAWLALPPEDHSVAGLHALLALTRSHSAGSAAAVSLYEALRVRDEDALAEALVRAWVRLAVEDRPPEAERMAEAVRGGPHAPTWARTAAELVSGPSLRTLVCAVAEDSPATWSAAGEALIRAGQRGMALLRLADLLPEAAEPLEPTARELLAPALDRTRFPSEDLAAVGLAFAQTPDAWPLWSLLAISAAPPGELDDSTIDATVVRFCQEAPGSPEEQALARQCLRLLGEARGWPVIDHARWVVRFLMVPPPVPEEQHLHLALELVQALARHEDGAAHLGAITNALLDLPPDHPALVLFLDRLLPRAWEEGAPPEFRSTLRTDVGNPRIRSLLERALRSGRL